MSQAASNQFNDMLRMDFSPFVPANSIIIDGENLRIVNLEGNTYALSNIAGTREAFELPSGFLPLAVSAYNDVAYLVLHNPTTGQGEVGTYPAPAAAGDNLVPAYGPLQNYRTDPAAPYGPFRTDLFNFSLTHRIRLELQPDYDGSINMVLTDGYNPMRIINSGFSVLPNGKFTRVEREGNKDTNRYEPASFSNTIQLQQKSSLILGVEFLGTYSGGKLPGGNYIYYFKYATADGNTTDIIGESGLVTVANGDTLGTTKGSEDATTKMARLLLSNLDTSYKFVQVFYVHAAGFPSASKLAYRLLRDIEIVSGQATFNHTGFEKSTVIDIAELNVASLNIDRVNDIAQAQGYLFGANVKEQAYDRGPLKDFGRSVTVGSKQAKLALINDPDSLDAIFSEKINQSSKVAGTAGYNGGYHNPRNVHDYLGYFGGEAYPFGMRFVLPNLTTTDTFPIIGIDNREGSKTITPSDADFAARVEAAITAGGFDTEAGVNTRGVYRFPNRNAAGAAPLLENNSININGVTMTLPVIPPAVKAIAIGVQFMRAPRQADLVAQGYVIPALNILRVNPGEVEYDHAHPLFSSSTSEQLKYVPAFLGQTEAVRFEEGSGGSETYIKGLFAGTWKRAVGTKEVLSSTKACFISGDVILDEAQFSDVLTSDEHHTLDFLQVVRAALRLPVTQPTHGSTFSLAVATSMVPATVGTKKVRPAWVAQASNAFNRFGFSSEINALEMKFNDDDFVRFYNHFDSYVGLDFVEGSTLNLASPVPIIRDTTTGNNNLTGSIAGVGTASNVPVAYNCNIYKGEQRTTEQLSFMYGSLNGLQYYPISKRYTWDELEAALDENRQLTLFNGDCFVGVTYRRLYINSNPKSEEDFGGPNVGETVQLVGEFNYNVAMREPEIVNTEERFTTGSARTFFPLNSDSSKYKLTDQAANSLRSLRLLESKKYNMGYHDQVRQRYGIPNPEDAPFFGSNWFARVFYTAKHVPNNFSNGYRYITGLNYQDYDSSKGEIMRIVSYQDELVVVQEGGVSLLSINERIQTAAAGAGAVFVRGAGVLPERAQARSEHYGSQHPNSVLATPYGVFGVDVQNDKIWALDQQFQFSCISDYVINEFLKQALKPYKGQQIEAHKRDIIASYNGRFKEVYFSFLSPVPEENFTISYQAEAKKFVVPSISYKAGSFLALANSLYSFKGGKFHEHDATSDHNNFYGTRELTSLTFLVNEGVKAEKVFEYMELVGNHVRPSMIEFWTENQYCKLVVGIDFFTERPNVTYKGKKHELIIPHSQDVNNVGALGWEAGSQMRDKILKVKITYDSADKLILHNVDTWYRQSFS